MVLIIFILMVLVETNFDGGNVYGVHAHRMTGQNSSFDTCLSLIIMDTELIQFHAFSQSCD